MDKEPEKTKQIKKLELIVFIAYISVSVFMFIYHEPWMDELQAYLIAKDASYYDILFVIPHFEGHPPFYSVILSFLAKTNVPVDIGLRLITYPFSLLATYLIVFKAPFNRFFRFTIPFTYYIFYQYTINCRPYSIMYLSFILCALFYKNKDKHPIRYIFALILMCFSHSYGLIFAGCFCISWVIEILAEYLKYKKFKQIYKDSRFWSLWCIFFVAVLEILIIWPDDNCFANSIGRTKNFSPYIYSLFEMLSDSTFTDCNFYRLVQEGHIKVFSSEGIISIIIGLVFLTALIIVANYFHKKRLLIPAYVCFCVYGCFGYLSEHHIGILHFLIIFVLWCCYDEHSIRDKSLPNKFHFIHLFSYICALSVVINLFWSISACLNDYKYKVWYSREFREFVNDFDLINYSFFDSFYAETADVDNSYDVRSMYLGNDVFPDMVYYTNITKHPTLIAYMDQNCIINLNNGDDNKRYILNKIISKTESDRYVDNIIKENGIPDFFIGDKYVLRYTDLYSYAKDYYIVKRIDYYIPIKFYCDKYSFYIYAYKDVYYSRDDWPFQEEMISD